MPMHLRGESCALRRAFLRWLLFTALLAVWPLLFWVVGIGVEWLGWRCSESSLGPVEILMPILLGPELLVIYPIMQYDLVPRGVFLVLAALALFVVRSCVVFAWGVLRLQRGKRAPYAETLWLISVCAPVAVWLNGSYFDFRGACAVAAVLAITGIVVFVLQRRRPPAWKRRTPP